MTIIMDIKVEIKKELEEYDHGFSSEDVRYMQSELSTEVDIKDVKKETQDNDSGIPQINNKMETKKMSPKWSYHKEQNISQHAEETILNKSIKVQMGQKPYTCEICFKTFTAAHNLKIHFRAHTGEKPYKCEICFKTFSTANKLKIHLRTHTGEKPYSCEICCKQFTVVFPTPAIKWKLKKHHLNIHTTNNNK
ncbi:uncharacterized protein [Diabrotica undecimpunctata]|uniref:uncharacterized protein isoform X2 n=1 Tax=Diabrotica undecimpunctata TaxID=50387 RepID=UPI003B63B5D9